MSPESYVLLLISCWLLLASALLWGMLRIARRHYASSVAEAPEQPVGDAAQASASVARQPARPRRAASQPYRGAIDNMLCLSGKLRF